MKSMIIFWLILILLILGSALNWWPTKTITVPNIATSTTPLIMPSLSAGYNLPYSAAG